MCKGIGYNMTAMPNQFNHETQDEAGMEVHQFWPLVEINCSPDLNFFLCSVYAPICIEYYDKQLPACRSVCERAKAGCAPIMDQYGFAWPERMDCTKLPRFGDHENLCMDERNGSAPNLQPKKESCSCLHPLVQVDPTYREVGRYRNISPSVAGVEGCTIPCKGVHFSDRERAFADVWISTVAVICCVSTLMTMTTFLIDMERFKYPERPIIFLGGCYFMVSLGYIIRLAAGHDAVACDGSIIIYNYQLIRYNEYGSGLCTTVFLLIYFFGMASSIWWVVLAFTWFLAAGLKWGNEAISSYSTWFHVAAWLIPTLQTIAVLTMAAVDGEPVAGICFVGNLDARNLLGFVLIPLFIYLVLGSCFLLAGFVSLFRIRKVIKQQGRSRTEKLEKLMIRIGVFSVLYTVPATVVICCYFYEHAYLDAWQEALACPNSAHKGTGPDASVLMLRYFMSLVVGITSGFWIWSSKTLESWRRFYQRVCSSNRGHTYECPSRLPKEGSLEPPPAYPAASANPHASSVVSHFGSVNKTLPLTHV
ncbi:hypothetical protein HAZT_HAZT007772 [Hyalella azteca]|nr:hypothetical protein HAZT_HAZT007772 [Hyalella azteca]